MKNLFLLLCILSTLSASASIGFCYAVNGEGVDSSCVLVTEVQIERRWHSAGLDNLIIPTGYSCIKVNDETDGWSPKMPILTPKNAFIRFSQGYRTWILESDKLYSHHRLIDLETMRSYLPIARKIFLKNERIESFSIACSDSISIIIQRPENTEKLQEEIIFPKRVSAAELSQMLRDLDDRSLQVYPNPARANMSVFFERNVGISKVEILSLKGESCYKRIYSEPRKELALELENLESATYILRITDSIDREFTRKIEKE